MTEKHSQQPGDVPGVVAALAAVSLACSSVGCSDGPDAEGPQVLERCADFDPIRKPFFGDLHVHTTLSYDANLSGTLSASDVDVETLTYELIQQGVGSAGPDEDSLHTKIVNRVEKELIAHGIDQHTRGFCSPLGKLKNLNLAIAGVFPLSGFFSKDEILYEAFLGAHGGFPWVWAVGLVTAGLTAFYMMRSYMLTFEGKPRWAMADSIRPKESPWTITVPLWVLGVLSLVGGFVGLPGVIAHGEWNWIHHFLGEPYGGPVAEAFLPEHGDGFLAIEWGLIALGLLLLSAGVVILRRH